MSLRMRKWLAEKKEGTLQLERRTSSATSSTQITHSIARSLPLRWGRGLNPTLSHALALRAASASAH